MVLVTVVLVTVVIMMSIIVMLAMTLITVPMTRMLGLDGRPAADGRDRHAHYVRPEYCAPNPCWDHNHLEIKARFMPPPSAETAERTARKLSRALVSRALGSVRMPHMLSCHSGRGSRRWTASGFADTSSPALWASPSFAKLTVPEPFSTPGARANATTADKRPSCNSGARAFAQ